MDAMGYDFDDADDFTSPAPRTAKAPAGSAAGIRAASREEDYYPDVDDELLDMMMEEEDAAAGGAATATPRVPSSAATLAQPPQERWGVTEERASAPLEGAL